MLSHFLTNFKIQKWYQNETQFNGVYFGVELIPKQIRKLIGNENIIINICKINGYNLIMFGYFCIRLIDFTLKGKKVFYKYICFSPNKK